MKRILFVDDDANVLSGLRNSMRNRRAEWNCVFALGPEVALKELEGEPFDVVISDMRMPKIDGAGVLAAAKRLQPKAVRMILSGQTEIETIMKSVFVAHVFLAKPCESAMLQQFVERSCNLQNLLLREDLRAALGTIEMLPPAPRCYTQLTQVLAKPDASMGEVAHVIEGDLALTTKILQLVNSAFFGLPRHIHSINEAVTFLGTSTIKHLVLALETFSNKLCPSLTPKKIDELAQFSLRVGRVARLLAGKDKRKAEEAFLAGLLHAVGQLLPFSKDLLQDLEEPYWPYLGAYLLGLWGLSHPIIEAIAYHQKPKTLPHESFELVDLIHMSHYLAQINAAGEIPSGLDREHLRTIGYDDEKITQAVESIIRCLEEDARASHSDDGRS